jgi:hypothetical protein
MNDLCYLTGDDACLGDGCAMRSQPGLGAAAGECHLTPALGVIYRMVEVRRADGVAAVHHAVRGMRREDIDAALTAAVCELTVALGVCDPEEVVGSGECAYDA